MPSKPDLTGCLLIHDGFCYPEWDMIEARINTMPDTDHEKAWLEAVRAWLECNRSQLGESYQVYETLNFFLLSGGPAEVGHKVCRTLEYSLKLILASLKGVASNEGFGKQVVIMLGDLDNYYQYISYFYPDGEHAMSGGVCLNNDGFVHFAFPAIDELSFRTILVHELTHSCLAHLPIPSWINESLAMRMENMICGTDVFYFDGEIRDRHRAFWNSQTIQHFWSGISWNIPGDSHELSYNLAYLLWQKLEFQLKIPHETLLDFILQSDCQDAGEGACRNVLSTSLADLIGPYLGKGDWRPKPDEWPNFLKNLEQPPSMTPHSFFVCERALVP